MNDINVTLQLDLTRQYKTMQSEMGLRIHQLETELARTRDQLGKNNCRYLGIVFANCQLCYLQAKQLAIWLGKN